ncbi:MAG TPA: choice-of-anchor J domain-containing protein [Ignavibacteria bacterium]|nr:choice-of-anchor J domain-containing protein [Ignavibacteria bacterium]
MKGKILISTLVLFLIAGVFLGFTNLNDDNPKKNQDPHSSKTPSSKTIDLKSSKIFLSDNNGGGYQTSGLPYYTDNFDGANDTSSLKARGYKVYYRGTGPQGLTATWFQGSTPFVAYNGPATGYVAANYNVVTSINNIDSWLVLPKANVTAGDSIVFYERSITGNPFPDSIRVMYSAAGDSVPEAAWTELGRFLANDQGVWERKAFGAPVSGPNARYAIRYNVVNGGPSGDNSNFIGIDALTLESSTVFPNDIATQSIDSVFNYIVPVNTIAPKATFKNIGSNNQVSIPVTYNVTGPVNYSNTKNIASLNSGATVQVTFDSTFTPSIPGTYNITVYSGLANDDNRLNDTLRTSFLVIQPNYGGGGAGTGGYFFANSTPDAAPAPSQPTYCRLDTSGSTSLVSNNVAVVPVSSGSLDDGYWTLSGITGAKKIVFMGVEYTDVYVGSNGIIGFTAFTPGDGNWNPPATGLPGGGDVRPAIYPAWNDLNFGDIDQPDNRLCYKVDPVNSRLIITFDKAPIFGALAGDFETFQVSIDLVNTGSPNSNITIAHSNSTSIINVPYLVGIQDATGANFIQYTFLDGSGNVITPGPLFDTTANGGVAVTFGPDPNTLIGPCNQSLGLKFNFESCPDPNAVTVELRSSISPYNLIESVNTTAGGNILSNVLFNNAVNGVGYYVVIKSANMIATWSAVPVTFTSGAASYDFTSALSQAYASNQKLSSGIPSVFQGDANQDDFVNSTDIILVYNDAIGFVTSPSTDFNCDGTTDVTDIILAANNASTFVQVQAP